MHIIEIYRHRSYPWQRWQYRWRCRFRNNIINEIVAEGGESYRNLPDLEASLRNFINKAPVAEWQYGEGIVR